jgi:hypothetical protein
MEGGNSAQDDAFLGGTVSPGRPVCFDLSIRVGAGVALNLRA